MTKFTLYTTGVLILSMNCFTGNASESESPLIAGWDTTTVAIACDLNSSDNLQKLSHLLREDRFDKIGGINDAVIPIIRGPLVFPRDKFTRVFHEVVKRGNQDCIRHLLGYPNLNVDVLDSDQQPALAVVLQKQHQEQNSKPKFFFKKTSQVSWGGIAQELVSRGARTSLVRTWLDRSDLDSSMKLWITQKVDEIESLPTQ